MQENNSLPSNVHRRVEEGLDFILNHLQEPLFPRKVMTKDVGYQLEAFNKEEALRYYKSSDYNDCRINAYPPYTEYHGINRTPVSFLMVDLDLKDFGGNVSKEPKLFLEKVLRNTLEKIKDFGGNPTVLWTGNGYHIYQPVAGFILEEYETFYIFAKYLDKDLTSLYIQFAEGYFTNYAADHLHNPTVKSCLLRIPGSLNSKCIENESDRQISIIQKWDGKRPPIMPLLRDFRRWLIQKRIDGIEELKRREKKIARYHVIITSRNQPTNNIQWIENGILKNPLRDHRKYIIWRVLSPYLLNVKKLPKEESYSIIKDWLDKCNNIERLNFNPKIKIKEGIRGASGGYFPISLVKLKDENKQLHDAIVKRL
ncbi:MAG: DNA primase noncatalytic subunit PriX [Candidatus Nitrosopolaris sp.]